MSLRIAAVLLSAGLIAGCTYYAPPPEPVYSYVPCPSAAAPPPPGAAVPTPQAGASGNQCLAATVPYPPYQYYVPPSYYPYGAPYYPGGISFGFGVVR